MNKNKMILDNVKSLMDSNDVFYNYFDVIDLEIFSEVYCFYKRFYKEYLEKIRQELLEDIPNLERIDIVNGEILLFANNILRDKKYSFGKISQPAKLVSSTSGGEFEVIGKNSGLAYLNKSYILKRCEEQLVKLLEASRTNEFFRSQSVLTLKDNFSSIIMTSQSAFTECKDPQLVRNGDYFKLVFSDNLSVETSNRRLHKVFEDQDNILKIAQRVLIREDQIPEFMREEVRVKKIERLNTYKK